MIENETRKIKNKLYVIKKQFLGSLANFSLSIFALSPASNNGTPLQGRGSTVKDKNRFGSQKQELTNATEESKQMSVANHFAFVITHRFDKLYHPYARV
jgi:hypothetical protein